LLWGNKFRQNLLTQLTDNHSDCLFGLTRHRHDLLICILPY
jgi:hypothetical protein